MDKCWDNEKMMKMSGDCLKLLRVLFIDPYNNKYVRLLIVVILVFHVPLWAVQFYYWANSPSIDLIIIYAPASIVFLYAFLSMLAPFYLKEQLIQFLHLKSELCWSINTASENIKKKILRERRKLYYVCIVNITLGILTYSTVVTRFDSGKQEIIYQITFFKQQFPRHARILIRIFQASLAVFVMPMISAVYITAYFIFHIHFQAVILFERVSKIAERHRINVYLICQDDFQRQVFKRIRFCIIRTQQIKGFCNETLRIIPKFVVTYIILAMLLAASFLGDYHLNADLYIPLLCSITVTSCYTGLIGFHIGQLTEDATAEFYAEFINLPWYTFNMKNRKMLLFVLLHSQHPLALSPYKMFPANRTGIVKLYKVFSTISAFLVRTRDRIANS